jgi:hypothetical protein
MNSDRPGSADGQTALVHPAARAGRWQRADVLEARFMQRQPQRTRVEQHQVARRLQPPPAAAKLLMATAVGIGSLDPQPPAGLEQVQALPQCGHGLVHVLDDMAQREHVKGAGMIVAEAVQAAFDDR